MRTEGEHGNPALYEIANAIGYSGLAQLKHREVAGLVTRRLSASAPNNLLQLAAKEEIAALEQHALQPASFCVR